MTTTPDRTASAAGAGRPDLSDDFAYWFIDELMVDLPAPRECTESIGIYWLEGALIGRLEWCTLLPGFDQQIEHDANYLDPVLYEDFKSRVDRLRGLCEDHQIEAHTTARIVKSFLISAVYRCAWVG